MLRLLFIFLLISVVSPARAQRNQGWQLHAHNDYVRPRPLLDAVEARADYIEADVFPVGDKLVVAHTRADIDTTRTLERLYLTPIAQLFAQHQNERVSRDRTYAFTLMIDVKESFDTVLPRLLALLQPQMVLFNRQFNPLAVRIVLSGSRPKPDKFLDFPPYIFFDGRPSEIYDAETLQRVALVSDNFRNYSRWDGTGDLPSADRDKLKRIIRRAHDDGKPIRFWNIPDQPNAWKQLRKLGVDIINTDNVVEAAAARR